MGPESEAPQLFETPDEGKQRLDATVEGIRETNQRREAEAKDPATAIAELEQQLDAADENSRIRIQAELDHLRAENPDL